MSSWNFRKKSSTFSTGGIRRRGEGGGCGGVVGGQEMVVGQRRRRQEISGMPSCFVPLGTIMKKLISKILKKLPITEHLGHNYM